MSNSGTTTISSAGTSTFITIEHRQNCAGTSTKCAGTSTPVSVLKFFVDVPAHFVDVPAQFCR